MQDKKYCYTQIIEARKIFSNNTTTETLALLYLYCCEEVRDQVLWTLNESNMRKWIFLKLWRKKNENI